MWRCTRHLRNPRGTPLIVSLLRLRHQYSRLGTAQARLQSRVRGAPEQATLATAASPTMIHVHTQRTAGTDGDDKNDANSAAQEAAEVAAMRTVEREALRLLDNPHTRLSQLTDVPPTSPLFGVEAGKTLLIAATFGASSEACLVKLMLAWCTEHVSQLQTTRQLMSLCTPLLNLSDGRTAGRAFFFRTFYDPLLAALARVANGTEVSSIALMDARAMKQQQCTAVVSVLSLTTRLLSPSTEAATTSTAETAKENTATLSSVTGGLTPRDVERVVALHMAASRALLYLLTPHSGTKAADGANSSDVDQITVSVTDCLVYVQSVVRVTQALQSLPPSLSPPALEEVYALCARNTAAVVHHWQPAVVAQSTGLTMRAADVTTLLQALRQVNRGALVRPLMQTCVALLPATMASASAKDLCAMLAALASVQVDFRDLVDGETVQRLLDALRPQLFLLAETHRAQLRPLECSQLLQRLSRCEMTTGVHVPHDLLNMLCQRFREQLTMVQGGQLVPFLQALARLAVTRRGSADDAVDAHCDERVRQATLQDCVERAVVLERQGLLSVLQAARMLQALLDLRSDRSRDLFVVFDRLLQTDADAAGSATTTTTGGMTVAERAEVVRVLRDFQRRCCAQSNVDATRSTNTDNVAPTEQSALADYVTVLQSAWTEQLASDVHNVATAAELLSYAATLSPQSTPPSAIAAPHGDAGIDNDFDEAAEEGDSDGDAALHVDDAAGVPQDGVGVETTVRCDPAAEAFVRRLTAGPMQCNLSEAAQLALTVGTLCAAGRVERGLAQAAVCSLLLCHAGSTHSAVTAADRESAKRMLDALRLVDLRNGTASVQAAIAALLQRIAAALQNAQLAALSLSQLVALAKTLRAQLGRQRGVSSPACDAAMLGAVTAFLHHCPHAMRRALCQSNSGASTSSSSATAFDAKRFAVATEVIQHIGQLVHDVREAHRGADEEEVPLPVDEAVAVEDKDDAEAATTVSAAAAVSDEAGERASWVAFDKAVTEALQEMGDILQRCLTQVGPSAITTLPPPRLTPRQVVTLVQAYEQAKVVHGGLMAALLPQLHALGEAAHDADSAMSPLQLSLLLNALLRLGVWNATTMRDLLRQITAQIPRCDVRQCHALLHGLQRTGFLGPHAIVTRSSEPVATTATTTTTTTLRDVGSGDADVVLESLAQDVVWRLDALVHGNGQAWSTLLTSCTLQTLVGVVRVLAYFDQLPQRTYDAYFGLAVRRLHTEVQTSYLTRGDAPNRDAAAGQVPALCQVVCGAVMLLATLPRVGRHDYRCKLARVMQQSLHSLQRHLPVMWQSLCDGDQQRGGGLDVEQLIRLVRSVSITAFLFADTTPAALLDTTPVMACVLARLPTAHGTASPAALSASCRQLRRLAQCLVMDSAVHADGDTSDARRVATVLALLQCAQNATAQLTPNDARDALQLCDCVNHCLCAVRCDAAWRGGVVALLTRLLSVACGELTSLVHEDDVRDSLAVAAVIMSGRQGRWSAHDAAVLFQTCAWRHSLAMVDMQHGATDEEEKGVYSPSGLPVKVLPAVSTALQAKDQQLDLTSAVHVLIGGMLLFARPHEADAQGGAAIYGDAQAMAAAHEAWVLAARAASLCLLTELDVTSVRLVALYRLMSFANGLLATCALPQSVKGDGEAAARTALGDVLLRGLTLLARGRLASPRDRVLRLSDPSARLVAEAVQRGVSHESSDAASAIHTRVKELTDLLVTEALPPSQNDTISCATTSA